MVIRDDASSVEIALLRVGAPGTPTEGDLGVRVAATAAANGVGGPFAGANDTVGIRYAEWTDLLEALRELERTRQGEARVMAMSPAEFQLAVFATDRAGHMAAEGWVGREFGGRNGVFHDRVCFRIAIDPSTLPHILRQFEAISPGG
jgi:hypothetical protein